MPQARELLLRLLMALTLLLAAAFAAAAQASPPLLDGALGSWLDERVAPELARTLSQHPMFKGETVRFASLRNGVPQTTSTELNEAIERRLTQRLLAAQGVRLAVDRPGQACQLPQAVNYIIGIEVSATGSRSASLNLAIIDAQESVWVSGISFQWQGRLSTAERLALASSVITANPGTAESPLPLADADQIARAIRERLRCSLPRGLDGPVYVSTAEDVALSRISLALQGELLTSPLAALTADRQSARWIMAVDSQSAGAQLQEIHVNLQDTDGAGGQRVASVFVAGAAPHRAAGVSPPPPVSQPPSSPLLSALSAAPAEPVGICDDRKARNNSCVEVAFDLRRAAYLMVFTTQALGVRNLSCESPLSRSDAGPRRFRLRVPPGRLPPATGGDLNPAQQSRSPDAGLYVIATEDRTAARRLHGLLQRAPGACRSSESHKNMQTWLAEVREATLKYAGRLEWGAIHLAHEPEGVVQL
jgi:hypothetical protein